MPERIAAQIEIGGTIRRRVAERLCDVIVAEFVSLEWCGRHFQPTSLEELLAARSARGDGRLTLHLYDEEASWGEFEDLEEFLRKHKIPFVRHTEGKYEFDPETVAYHPRCGLVQWLTDHSRKVVIHESEVRPVADSLGMLVAEVQRGELDAAKLARKLQRVCGKLRKCLPPDLPQMEEFRIAEDKLT